MRLRVFSDWTTAWKGVPFLIGHHAGKRTGHSLSGRATGNPASSVIAMRTKALSDARTGSTTPLSTFRGACFSRLPAALRHRLQDECRDRVAVARGQ